ncbi:class I SAM-dependent methyltransferase [Actinomadura sp. KC345]|uniref:class I SAM-dependent methyltransferase n=1 Tax=Actinomadura sp. KC345 TaxID=2530371 RepID=UPI0010458A3A|nr:class I SAM-dependent methyltransferase [Actinomadura sp. KC345]TDC41956.1 class I SAM-dependent methyltransferase [Actinomadura sp. KC345]
MYGVENAQIYELIHEGRGKDYLAEAEEITRRVRRLKPDAGALLDVACGTGAHLGYFARLFARVEGLELSEAMVAVAARRLAGVPVHAGDMRAFDLGRTFDVITCMFGALGYAETEAELRETLRCFARHLVPGGVAAVDPWWFPENFLDGHVSGDVAAVDGLTVARVSHSARDGAACRMNVHYVVAGARSGVRHFEEAHRISLFRREQYEAAFAAAGFTVGYVDGLHSGRGLFVGVRD